MARLVGSRSVKVEPSPRAVRSSTAPPKARTLVTTTSVPPPRPETSDTCAAVLKPGRASTRIRASSSEMSASDSISPRSLAALSTRARSIPRPPSAPRTAPASRSRAPPRPPPPAGSGPPPSRPLPGGEPFLRRFQAMVHRVPQQVDQRIADLIQQRPVQLDVFSFNHEFDLLAEPTRQVADQPGESIEPLPHRGHAGLQDLVLELGGELGDAPAHLFQGDVGLARRDLHQLPAGGHQPADPGHQAGRAPGAP